MIQSSLEVTLLNRLHILAMHLKQSRNILFRVLEADLHLLPFRRQVSTQQPNERS